jgi:hypothetical protein
MFNFLKLFLLCLVAVVATALLNRSTYNSVPYEVSEALYQSIFGYIPVLLCHAVWKAFLKCELSHVVIGCIAGFVAAQLLSGTPTVDLVGGLLGIAIGFYLAYLVEGKSHTA